MPAALEFPRYTLRRASLSAEIVVFDPHGAPALVCRASPGGLRRILRVAAASDPARTLLTIRPRRSASGRVDIVTAAGESHPLGAIIAPLQAVALRSVWQIRDAAGRPLAAMTAQTPESLAAAGQVYTLEAGDQQFGRLNVHPRRLRPQVDLELTTAWLDPRLALAAALILCSSLPGVE